MLAQQSLLLQINSLHFLIQSTYWKGSCENFKSHSDHGTDSSDTHWPECDKVLSLGQPLEA